MYVVIINYYNDTNAEEAENTQPSSFERLNQRLLIHFLKKINNNMSTSAVNERILSTYLFLSISLFGHIWIWKKQKSYKKLIIH